MLPLLLALSSSLSPARADPPAPALEPVVLPRRGHLLVLADGGPGEHVAPDAPARVVLSGGAGSQAVEALGAALVEGLRLTADPAATTLTVEAVLCEDGGTRCRPAAGTWTLSRTGRQVALTPVAAAPEAPAPSAAAHGTAEAAFAAAAASGAPVLLDFGAVWCPPCNLLGAEVLHDPADAAALSAFAVAEVDVDRPESWPLKDRYAVGGYPTLLVARPDGTEIDRLVGYPGEAEVLAWLAEVAEAPALGALPDPAALSPTEAARVAARLATAARPDDARPFLARAEAGAEAHALAVARLKVAGSPEAAVAAVAGAARPGDWMWDALDLAADHPAVADALRAAAPRWLAAVGPVAGADVLYAVATLAPEAEARVHYAAAAALLEGALTGDPAADRGHWTGLATLHARAGAPERAVDLLERAAETYPDEFTFHYALAGHLLDLRRLDAAEAAARAALEHGYGDHRLRAARRLAEVMAAAGDRAGALALVEATLADAPRPAAGTRVRTFRYLRALEDLRRSLSAAPERPSP